VRVLVDTSAYYALADRADIKHEAAKRAVRQLLDEGWELWTTSYVVLEAAALVQSRLGMRHLRLLREALTESTAVVWVDSALHEAAWDELERLGRRGVSLVDCSLAVAAQRHGIADILAFDPDFELWGLRLLG